MTYDGSSDWELAFAPRFCCVAPPKPQLPALPRQNTVSAGTVHRHLSIRGCSPTIL